MKTFLLVFDITSPSLRTSMMSADLERYTNLFLPPEPPDNPYAAFATPPPGPPPPAPPTGPEAEVRKRLTDFLDTRSEIQNWYAFLWSALFLVSDSDTYTLTMVVRRRFPQLTFVLSQVESYNTNGSLPTQAWDFLNDPKPSGLHTKKG